MKKSLVYLTTAIFALSAGSAFAGTKANKVEQPKPGKIVAMQTLTPKTGKHHKSHKGIQTRASVKAPVKVSAKLATPAKTAEKPATKTEKK